MILRELLDDMDFELVQGSLDTDIHNIQNDSRKIEAGDLFFCISGAVSDGHKYAGDVIEKGAIALVVEKDVEAPSNVTVIKLKSSRYAMGVISSKFYGEPSKKLTVIGITGTKGKTTTTYMIMDMLLEMN